MGKGNHQSSNANKQQVKLTDLANRIKGFIKGVKIRFSETPYQGDGREVRKSIRESEQKNWNKILDAFENKTAGADATFHHHLLDHTPAVYQRLGVKDLPITIRGSVIHKMIGNIRNSEYDYHEIPILELRNLLIDLDNPVAVFDSKSDPNAFVVLTNILDKHGNLKSVVPLKLERDTSGNAKENAIASGYGQKPENMQRWIDEGYLRYVSKKALEKSAQRLQLPRDSILRAKGVLMENDFSSEQLGDIIPDFGAAVKGVDEKKEGVVEVINLRDSKGDVVGTYNRETNEMVVYPGADADTIGHELCGHATWQYAEQQARKGDSRLLEKMQEVVDAPTAKPVWDEVKANYEGEDRAVQREEVWAHIIGHQTSKAIEEIQKSRSGRRWYQKFWNVVRDAWKGLLSSVRINSIHLEGTEEMSPKEFSEYIVKQMLERKTLGNISKEVGGEEGAERRSIRSKSIVTPEEDAAYMEAVKKGDMETAAKMVREVAGRAFPNTKVIDVDGLPKKVYHGGNFRKYETVPDLKPGEMHFGTLKAALERVAYKYQGMEDVVSIDGYYLNLENPKRTKDIGGDSIWLDYGNEEDRKYDGVVYENESEDKGEDSYGVSWEPSRIKSADPVTYDNNGNVIPLSRRFDNGDDIRGDVSGKQDYVEKMELLHPNLDANEVLSHLSKLRTPEEMVSELDRIIKTGNIDNSDTSETEFEKQEAEVKKLRARLLDSKEERERAIKEHNYDRAKELSGEQETIKNKIEKAKKKAEKLFREEAKKAFPNTKVVGKDGLPLIVYHGTVSTDRIKQFDDRPIFAFHREDLAAQYTHQRQDLWVSPSRTGRVMPMVMNLENPYIVDAGKRLWDRIKVDWSPTPVSTDDIVKHAKENGYDGVIIKQVRDNMFDNDRAAGDEYIAFSPSQVKETGATYKKVMGYGLAGEYEEIEDVVGSTIDDKGNVVSMSRRFDKGNDLRGDVKGNAEYFEKMETHHPDINPEELINRLKGLGSREEMEAEIKKVLGKK